MLFKKEQTQPPLQLPVGYGREKAAESVTVFLLPMYLQRKCFVFICTFYKFLISPARFLLFLPFPIWIQLSLFKGAFGINVVLLGLLFWFGCFVGVFSYNTFFSLAI